MGEFDYRQLDDIIHSRIRLAVMAILVGIDQADFIFLRNQVNATDGNLSIHLRKLEEAGYIYMEKRFRNRKPVSSYQITDKGRKAFEIYLERLDKILNP